MVTSPHRAYLYTEKSQYSAGWNQLIFPGLIVTTPQYLIESMHANPDSNTAMIAVRDGVLRVNVSIHSYEY
jgi:hypothetical protein